MDSKFYLYWMVTAIFFSMEIEGREPVLSSWVESANYESTDFPIQNLPYGVFEKKESSKTAAIGVAIGDYVFDLKGAVEKNLLDDLSSEMADALKQQTLNPLMALDPAQHHILRQKLIAIFQEDNRLLRDNSEMRSQLLVPRNRVNLLLPIQIGDYTDFYASIDHARNVGAMMRPDNPLMPNYKHMPIGYHGRSSSIIVSGTPVRWPFGQMMNDEGSTEYGLCRKLDFELEMGAIIGRGNRQGYPIAIDKAASHIFGFVLLNDWSARDVQKWEYQPLGPFNGKNFATTISPWIVTSEALEPYRTKPRERFSEDPRLLDYLDSPSLVTYEIGVEAYFSSENMRTNGMKPLLICKGNFKDLYWNFEQMVTQHTSSGCNLRTGDLLGSGTLSGKTPDSLGCLLERIALKLPLLQLPDGTSRQYLIDGDEIILCAHAHAEGYPKIGFGECSGVVSRKIK